LKTGGAINPKYPGGVSRQKKLLQAEGHRVECRGTQCFVAGYEKALAVPTSGLRRRD
jgi:hypothetical protein